MKIVVHNKQRRHKIDLLKLESMSNKLANALFDNFKKNRPQAVWMPYLNNIKHFASLSLIIVSPQAIRKLNKQWLQKDKETDVLSFPLLDLSSKQLAKELSMPSVNGEVGSNKQKNKDLVEFGEIFISYEQAIKQAEEYNHSLERELAFLFVHGLLHIFGFDHQDKKSEKEMFDRQRTILNESGYLR